jgi:ABC-type Fe2+-enterobactin transport system substrate-binding protein
MRLYFFLDDDAVAPDTTTNDDVACRTGFTVGWMDIANALHLFQFIYTENNGIKCCIVVDGLLDARTAKRRKEQRSEICTKEN